MKVLRNLSNFKSEIVKKWEELTLFYYHFFYTTALDSWCGVLFIKQQSPVSWLNSSTILENVTLKSLSHSPLLSPLLWFTCYEKEELEQKNRLSSSTDRAKNNDLDYKHFITITSYDHVRATVDEPTLRNSLIFLPLLKDKEVFLLQSHSS